MSGNLGIGPIFPEWPRCRAFSGHGRHCAEIAALFCRKGLHSAGKCGMLMLWSAAGRRGKTDAAQSDDPYPATAGGGVPAGTGGGDIVVVQRTDQKF